MSLNQKVDPVDLLLFKKYSMYDTNMWLSNEQQREYIFSYPEAYLKDIPNGIKYSLGYGVLPMLIILVGGFAWITQIKSNLVN